jgi:hypothetical protein
MVHLPSVRLSKAVALALLLMAFAAPARAQSETVGSGGFAKEGGYVGISAIPGFTFDGITFDGSTVYREVDGEELALLPRLDKHATMRVVVESAITGPPSR